MLIAASYDLHGNVSQTIVDSLDIFSTYRTAPHIDVPDTMRRAVTMLVRALCAPVSVQSSPGRRCRCCCRASAPRRRTSRRARFYTQLQAVEDPTGIWDASFQVGYVWADEPRATACAVVTGTDRAAMTEAARHLAQDYWDIREGFVFGTKTGSIEECVDWAMTSDTGPVVLAESGDNPTGGGVGDRAEVLAELIERNAQGVIFAGIADKPATDAAYAAGVGATIDGQHRRHASIHRAGRSMPRPKSCSCSKPTKRACARRWCASAASIWC